MCKRNRPKFKVGDILEDYAYLAFTTDGNPHEILHWLVVEVKFEPRFRRKRNITKKRALAKGGVKKIERRAASSYGWRSGWMYTLRIISRSGEEQRVPPFWHVDFKTIDKYLTIKKVA